MITKMLYTIYYMPSVIRLIVYMFLASNHSKNVPLQLVIHVSFFSCIVSLLILIK